MKELIDSRNEKLWSQINERYNVAIEESKNGEYSCFSQNDNVTFYILSSDLCKDSFTHEMLHVYLRMNDCFIGAGLKNTINQSRILTSILTPGLLEHMGNCLDHIKMLPIFLDMGFDRTKFIMDYDKNKCTSEELKSLKRNYRIGKKINPKAVDIFVGKVFAIKADPNDSFDYSLEMASLKKIDPLLFQILDKMIEKWKQLKVENRDIMDDDYHTILIEFYDDMKKWISKTKIAK